MQYIRQELCRHCSHCLVMENYDGDGYVWICTYDSEWVEINPYWSDCDDYRHTNRDAWKDRKEI